jgi:hypothetical protein
LECTFTSFFKDKKSKRSHKTVGFKVFSRVFILFLDDDRRIRIQETGSAYTYGSGFGSGSATLVYRNRCTTPKTGHTLDKLFQQAIFFLGFLDR